MRYRDIIDEFEDETEEERDERYALQYGADDDADDAEVMLLRAKAEKLRAETKAILRKQEAEHDEIMLRRAQELLDARFRR
ncbi:hypothetical protein GGQ97_002219 [Sphingomonas kaistensis]|uniref:Uncharacterized protein n=1 Tax=Sphingomonas kaistensis TaxID=298708 RepID=A0A7X6BHS6_9SPHN|nr:hypothetical protein [Sphingomonas kaistensis]NJC06426.1 hypothetical protein [Sphingomonas kaistensis]